MAPTDLTETPPDADAGNGAAGGTRARRGAKPLVIVESPAKAKTIAGLLGSGYVVESSIGHIRDLPRRADEVPAAFKGEAWSRPGRGRRQRLQAALRGLLGEEVPGGEVEAAGQAGQRGLSGLGRGPRGRVDRLAPARGAGPDRCRSSAWSSTRSPARPSSGPSTSGVTSTAAWSTPRRPGGSSTGSTATRCRPSCGRRSCPGCPPAGSRAWPPAWWSSVSGPGWPSAPPVGGASTPPSPPPRPAAAAEGTPRSFTAALVGVDGVALASGRDFDERGALTSPGSVVVLAEAEARSLAAGLVDVPFTVKSMTHKPFRRSPVGPVHDLDPAAGGRAQAPVQLQAGHADRPAPLRGRLDHLHAHRLDHAVEPGPVGGPGPGLRPLRRRVRAGPAPALRAQGQERPGGPRGHPAGRRVVPDTRRGGPVAVGGRVPPLRPDLEAHGRLPDGRRHRHQRPGPPGGDVGRGSTGSRRGRPSSRRRARSSSSRGTCGPMWRARTIPRPSWPTGRSTCRPCPRGTRCRWTTSSRGRTPPSRRPGTRRRRWSRPWRSSGWAAPPPMPVSSPPSSTAATSGRRAPPWSPRSPPSPWSDCSSGTSPTWSTTGSPPRWRTTSMPSPRGTRSRCPG